MLFVPCSVLLVGRDPIFFGHLRRKSDRFDESVDFWCDNWASGLNYHLWQMRESVFVRYSSKDVDSRPVNQTMKEGRRVQQTRARRASKYFIDDKSALLWGVIVNMQKYMPIVIQKISP